MPVVGLVLGALAIAIGVEVLHNSASQSSSTLNDTSSSLEDILEMPEKIDKEIKSKLLQGIVVFAAKIFSSKAKEEKQQEEMTESISNELGSSLISMVINTAQNVIEELNDVNAFSSASETIATGVNDVTDISNSSQMSDGGAIQNTLIPPSIPGEGAIPNPLNPPDIGPVGTPPLVPPDIGPIGTPPLVPPDIGPIGTPPLIPPDIGPIGTPPLIPPAVASKGLEDYINWAKKNKTKNKEEGDIPPQRYVGSNEEKVKTSKDGLDQHPEISELARSNGAKDNNENVLDKKQKKIANKLLDMLNTMRQAELDGDTATVDRIKDEFFNKYREHPLSGDYNGWTSLDLKEKNSYDNKYRLLYKEESDGIKWKIVRMHE